MTQSGIIPGPVGFLSRRAARTPHMAALLGRDVLWLPLALSGSSAALAGWGRKRSGDRAQMLARRRGLPFLLLEDGFLRSVEREDPPLSLVVDDRGIYYDATRPSRLEKLIPEPLGPEQQERARAVMEAWRRAGVSKYNHAREYEGELPERFVLVCDQTFGDASISGGLAGESAFGRMLKAALDENPDCTVLVKTHPDIFTRNKSGYFDAEVPARDPRIRMISMDCHPVRLIEQAEAVYTVTSQMGFEALIREKRVRTFGMPFYAGWGLTEDELPAPARRGHASREQLVYAALIAYPRYVDPEAGQPCELETVLAHIRLQRRMRSRFARDIYAIGFSPWKQRILRRFLAGSKIHFVDDAARVPAGSTIAVWGRGRRGEPSSPSELLRIEDGFLRSVGLGADLVQPVSWAFDDVGIYYDATRPSRLERLLAETDFDEELLARARSLRRCILLAGLTKYNVATTAWRRPPDAGRVILVPGQVEDDASIRFGAADITTNLGLLRAVRSAHPGAYVVYKPHPDVIAGLREAGENEDSAGSLCDEIVRDAGMAQLLQEVDEVHTLTSLTGFEALMRGRAVSCYGWPFYAGWGLTVDMVPISRRQRRLTLDELVAASLILYPVYVSRITGRFTTPEQAVEELVTWRETGGGGLPAWRRALRPVFRMLKQKSSNRAVRPPPVREFEMEAANGGK